MIISNLFFAAYAQSLQQNPEDIQETIMYLVQNETAMEEPWWDVEQKVHIAQWSDFSSIIRLILLDRADGCGRTQILGLYFSLKLEFLSWVLYHMGIMNIDLWENVLATRKMSAQKKNPSKELLFSRTLFERYGSWRFRFVESLFNVKI